MVFFNCNIITYDIKEQKLSASGPAETKGEPSGRVKMILPPPTQTNPLETPAKQPEELSTELSTELSKELPTEPPAELPVKQQTDNQTIDNEKATDTNEQTDSLPSSKELQE